MCIRDRLDEILTENNQLRNALQYLEKSPLSLVAARVISRKPTNWYNTLVIDKGAVSYTHLRAHETVLDLVCRLLLEKKNKTQQQQNTHTYNIK